MRQTPAPQDHGIRSIFFSALEIEDRPKSRLERIRDAIDRRLITHAAIGAIGGAALSVGAFAGILAATPAPEPAPVEVAAPLRTVAVDVTKADRTRMIGGKLASLAIAPTFAGHSVGDISVVGGAALTMDEPLAYVGAANATATTVALERMFAQPKIMTASLGDVGFTPPRSILPETSPTVVEDDDDANIVPIPRARPEPVVPAVPLSMPRPRPNLPAIAAIAAPGVPAPVVEEPAPAPKAAPGQILGFFSSPTEAAKSGTTRAIDTPFGVPYVLQQGSVETACLKPELVEILRKIEGRYHHKVVITSGFRDRGRQGSLHRTCAAADIEVPGVAAATLAAFARTLPEIGGVGTYCHPTMIHVDIGTPRDWKYGCGSFFAMRGAPSKSGKVPGNMARASTTPASLVDTMTQQGGETAED